jgi:glutamate dehydrogenase
LSDLNQRAGRLIALGAPEALAQRIAGLVNLYSAGDIVGLAKTYGRTATEAAAVYYAVGTRFRLGRLRAACEAMDAGGHWRKLAIGALVEEIYVHQLALADQALALAEKGEAATASVERWLAAHATPVAQAEAILTELWATPIDDLAQVAVASRQLRALAQAATTKG